MKVVRIVALILCLVSSSAIAATYPVNSTNDTMTAGTLRWAIMSANTNPGPDTVSFNLGAGASISPTGQLPSVTNAYTTIDGTTQPDYSIANLVRIYGKSSITNGFDITASNCTVKALAVYGFGRIGIYLHQGHRGVVQGCHVLSNGFAGIETTGYGHLIGGTNAAQRNVISANTNGIYLAQGWSNNTIIGNFIGTDVTGTRTNGNKQAGIYVDHNSGNLIGSVTNGARNIISGNAWGIYLNSTNATQNVIVNNYIGLDSNGTTRLGNWNSGIYLDQAARNRIGGTNVAERNIISGNLRGVILYERGSFSNVIQGNYIGLSATGALMSNDAVGIRVSFAPSNVIGGAVSGAGNVIGGGQHGVQLEGTNTVRTVIQGNKIGVDPTGTAARPSEYAIDLGDSLYTQVGGTNELARNIISGSSQSGIKTADIAGGYHVIEGNYIGTDVSGMLSISNHWGGIAINRPGCRVGGTNAANRNVISGNEYVGIVISGTNATNTVVYGNYIGVDVTGTNALRNGNGIMISGSRNALIGSSVAGCGNVISGNGSYGIDLGIACSEVRILNNYIGVDVTGVRLMSNGAGGIHMQRCSPTNYIGGSSSERNVIAGNGTHGIYAQNCTGLVIRANLVGLNTNFAVTANGLAGIRLEGCRNFDIGGPSAGDGNRIGGNGFEGVYLYAISSNGYVRHNSIGVLASGAVVSNGSHGIRQGGGSRVQIETNVISANGGDGIRLEQCSNDEILGNFIGTDAGGTIDLGNMGNGIYVDGPGVSNFIGGGTAPDRNVISGNGGCGIFLNGPDLTHCVISGNRIGTDAAGANAVPNGGDGVLIYGANCSYVGGLDVASRNIISGNAGAGILVGQASDTQIKGNHIGTGATGVEVLPNGDRGVFLGTAASNNVLGGDEAGAGNIIAFNRRQGVLVNADNGNVIMANSIKRNGETGIDLGNDGVTANDASGDSDTGANDLQNYPILVSATNNGAFLTVAGTLNSLPSTTFLVELFGSRDPDLTGYGEGEEYFVRLSVTTDVSGATSFTGVVPLILGPRTPNFITATATTPLGEYGNTSEFGPRFFLDSDGDGMGDGYEAEYFGGYTSGDPAGHADADGVNNLDEFLAETDPLDAGSCLRVSQLWRESWGDRCFVAPASDCRNYEIKIAWDLMNPLQVWWDWPCSITRTNGSITFTEGGSSFNPTFYRVVAEIP